eukprot:scaffold11894_cov53-Attheya_sp.AAC.2
MSRYKYMQIPVKYIPASIMEQYKLAPLIPHPQWLCCGRNLKGHVWPSPSRYPGQQPPRQASPVKAVTGRWVWHGRARTGDLVRVTR